MQLNAQNYLTARTVRQLKLCFGLFFSFLLVFANVQRGHASQADYERFNEAISSSLDYSAYHDYRLQFAEYGNTDEYSVNGADYTQVYGMEPAVYEDYMGKSGKSVLTGEDGYIEYTFDVKQEGLYNLELTYFPVAGKSSDIQRGIMLDGQMPFSEAGIVEFSRVWKNELTGFEEDNRGNQLRPRQKEFPEWKVKRVMDSYGYYNEPLEFYFSKGKHTVTLVSLREPMVINTIKLVPRNKVPTYQEYLAKNADNGLSGQNVVIPAESAVAKSSPMLYAITDHSTPAVTPYNPSKIRMNTIGGNNWRDSGMWIEWELDVPQTGYYNINLASKQNFIRGTYVSRRLYLDGDIPFQEVNEIHFNYNAQWRNDILGGENPYKFYLTAGKHTLKLEVTMGDMAEFYRGVEVSIRNINDIYRQILMVTGYTPDQYRDYQIARKFPNMVNRLTVERDRLQSIVDELKSRTGESGDREAPLTTMITELNRLIDNIELFPKKLADFKVVSGGLGTWLMMVREMPLQLDSITLLTPDQKPAKLKTDIVSQIVHEASTLFYSFIIDYNAIGNVVTDKNAKKITAWIGGGRDQANSLKSLIDENFTKDTGIQVNLMLVDMNTLLAATLSGQGPDVAMQVGNDLPMNYALRGAVADLTQFSDFNEVTKRFLPSAMVPFEFEGKYYALPETQSFSMLFYRKDVLRELGLKIPQTWDDVKIALSVLDKNYMMFGLGSTTGLVGYADLSLGMFLYQMGGQLYSDDKKSSMVDSDIGLAAFKEWTRYYTEYGLTQEYDFASRFRTGEMPLALADFTMYNMLQVSAPEIKGLWGFTTIPGTKQPDGSINRSILVGGSASVIMDKAKDKQSSWEYIKWWTSADTQIKYAREMEGLMGASARYPTANQEAFSMLPWPVQDYNAIMEQAEHVVGIPRIPGGYFSPRHIANAFYKVTVNKNASPRESLMYYVRFINDEITYKRKEFNLD